MAARASTESTAPGVETLEARLELLEQEIANVLHAIMDLRYGPET